MENVYVTIVEDISHRREIRELLFNAFIALLIQKNRNNWN